GRPVVAGSIAAGSSDSGGLLAPRREHCFVASDEARSDLTDSIFSGEQERIQYHEPRIWGWNSHANLHDRPDAGHVSLRRLDQHHGIESNIPSRKLDLHDSWSLQGVWTDSSFEESYSLREFQPAELSRAAGNAPKHEAVPR